MDFHEYIDLAARSVEALGVGTIIIGTIFSLGRFLFSFRRDIDKSYKLLRDNLGKAILLGLEILVAADIIATVVTSPTVDQVLALGLIVLIRTFLSFSIQTELEGKWPWQRRAEEK